MKSWVRIYQEEGRLTPGQAFGLKPYKLDREALRKEVQEHPELFQSEHAQIFGVVPSTLSKAFQQLGITRKKNLTTMQKLMKNKGKPSSKPLKP